MCACGCELAMVLANSTLAAESTVADCEAPRDAPYTSTADLLEHLLIGAHSWIGRSTAALLSGWRAIR